MQFFLSVKWCYITMQSSHQIKCRGSLHRAVKQPDALQATSSLLMKNSSGFDYEGRREVCFLTSLDGNRRRAKVRGQGQSCCTWMLMNFSRGINYPAICLFMCIPQALLVFQAFLFSALQTVIQAFTSCSLDHCYWNTLTQSSFLFPASDWFKNTAACLQTNTSPL